MSSYLPIVLSGRTLGDRHRQLNLLVQEAFRTNVDFKILENVLETSPLDRLFKIDLASKYQLADYILKNLKDEDMLYVSRALKSKWLLEPKHCDIINPVHLEQALFPVMMTTSVNKMKQWIHLYLRDPQRCQQFYQYYIEKDDDIAMSFFWHCSNEFILRESKNLLVKMTPQQLKLMVEKCPQVAKVYYNSLKDNSELITKYNNNSYQYYSSLKCVLKSDIDFFLDVTETYYNINFSRRLNPSATKYIMKHRKERIMKKSELYTAYVLDVKTLAKCLITDEIKNIITNLARAEYVPWFSYKNVEPLLKQLQPDDRVQFKKIIFVDKLIGEKVKEWPYTVPSPPVLKPSTEEKLSLDKTHNPRDYEIHINLNGQRKFKRMIKKRKFGKWDDIADKSQLDKLFDRFRFQNFERTFHVLRKEILATSSIENRMQMMLVLVSKTGGRVDAVQNLLKWLVAQHSNEVITLRAAVVRSLVKRATVWRLPETSWQLLLQFARGLGLDGTAPEADCTEGLHAVFLRNLLSSTNKTIPILEAYLRDFSSLSEYSLTTEEKHLVKQRLPVILLTAAEEKLNEDTCAASKLIVKVLDVLQAYAISADSFASVLSTVKTLASKDPASAEELLLRLYKNHIARKHLTRENFNFIQTEASYLNALRHEPELLITSEQKQQILDKDFGLDGFLYKLAIYFSEHGGLAKQFMEVIIKEMKEKPRVNLVRPLAILSGTSFVAQLKNYDAKPQKSIKKRITRGLRANAHIARPKFNLDEFGWREAGVMAVANNVMICSASAIPTIVEKLMQWRRAARVVLRLAIRGGLEVPAFSSVVKLRPTVALKVALAYVRGNTDGFNPRVWDLVKPLITIIDMSSREYLQKELFKVNSMPDSLRAEYAMLVYVAFKRFSMDKAIHILCHIDNNLADVDDDFATTTIKELLSKKLSLEELGSVINEEYEVTQRFCLFTRIIGKHLLLCRSEEEQNEKIENVGRPFLEILESIKSDASNTKMAIQYLNEFILEGLKYTRVYMDSSYVSCLPVLREVADWMNDAFPRESWFPLHLKLAFNVILFKAIKQVAEKDPKAFLDAPNITYDGLRKIGIAFGKGIVEGFNMIEFKFSSFVDLYWNALRSYIDDSFESVRDIFAVSVCKGILEDGTDSSVYYIAYMLNEEFAMVPPGQGDDIRGQLQLLDDSEILFFINSDQF